MASKTEISWTESTWNPVTGCTKVSPGCDHCYAEGIAERFRGGKAFPQGFDLQLRLEKLDLPARWREPRLVFVNSMSDLFHEGVPDDYIDRVFETMAAADRHTYQLLTKRHARMRAFLRHRPVLPNVWLGCSVEDQKWSDIRVPVLLDTPAAVRWLSCEPLLGPVDLTASQLTAIDWLVVGGESGRGARPMEPEWARSLRDQCTAAGVAFHFKQAGAVLARRWGLRGAGAEPDQWPEPFPRDYPAVTTKMRSSA